MALAEFSPWSTLRGILGRPPSWIPTEDQERIAAYAKYDEIYWNDSRMFSLRVLEGEQPLYIPNARTVVDTTSHYLLKGLAVNPADENDLKLKEALKNLLDRELFYPRFHTAKHAGVCRGDYAFHLTGNPNKVEGTRLSLNSVDPGMIFPIWDDNAPDKLIGCHIADIYKLPGDDTTYINKLTYRLEEKGEVRRITREQGIYELEPKWYGPEPKLKQQLIPRGYLDDRITAIPVYWFKNIDWESWEFGASELKGFESILRSVDQGSTDVSGALSLEGLGVYATDGGRPVDDTGLETDWEVAPGRVMEVPSGAYFRRVEGVGSITPAIDQINYLESKLREAGGLSDVALGRIDVQTAQSGIALAIKFLPTLAKIEERDTAGIARLKQLFFDWKTWHEVFEFQRLEGELLVEIGEKLPQNRTENINELNNMMDRQVISRKYYREQMAKLGYEFPDDMEAQIAAEKKADAELAALTAPPGLQENASAAVNGEKPPPSAGGVAEGSQTPRGQDARGLPKRNTARNGRRVNESSGTEA